MRVETTRVIDLTQFTDEDAIDPMYVDSTYYLAPDGPVAAEAFATMRDGMAGKRGLAKSRSMDGSTWLPSARRKKGLD